MIVKDHRWILVDIEMGQAMADQRLAACRRALELTRSIGIDQLRLQVTFLVDPPPGLADRLNELIGKAGRRFGWTRITDPSDELLETALAACPFLMAVNFFHGKSFVVATGDAADALAVVLSEAGWQTLRPQREEILGKPLHFETIEVEEPG